MKQEQEWEQLGEREREQTGKQNDENWTNMTFLCFFLFLFFVTFVVVALALTTKCTWISIRRSVSASIGSHGNCPNRTMGQRVFPLCLVLFGFLMTNNGCECGLTLWWATALCAARQSVPLSQFLPQIKQTAVNCKIYWLSHPNAADI